MIVRAKEEMLGQMSELWNEAFGDAITAAEGYLSVLLKYFYVYEEQGDVCGMLSLLPISLDGKKGRYVYAVATNRKDRGRGVATALIEYAKKLVLEGNVDFLVLVPAKKSLFEYYKRRGFLEFMSVKNCVKICDGKCFDSYTEKIGAEEYFLLRKKYFNNPIEWDEDFLEFARKMYRADFVRVYRGNKEIGGALCFCMGRELVVKELCVKNEEAEFAVRALAYEFSAERVKYSMSDCAGECFAMIYPHAENEVYFGIELD